MGSRHIKARLGGFVIRPTTETGPDHQEVNAVRIEEEKDNLPKEKENVRKGEPHEEVEEIPFKKGKAKRTFPIGTNLGEEHKQKLIALVREYEDVFPWGPKNVPGLANDEKNKAIREELQSLLKAYAIRELKFPNWIANAVLVKKPNNKFQMCTDFTSLNKACPKDFYLLPCLGRLVEGITGN
ncbi:hypothetical protein LIER_27644 [Lithospermum erythrorhizon]|uniref:Reverse transcriptase n=1 Tax=Lithospermum erythrorhizon TaxID=34254 RepID=A0AAV3RCV3_LITER